MEGRGIWGIKSKVREARRERGICLSRQKNETMRRMGRRHFFLARDPKYERLLAISGKLLFQYLGYNHSFRLTRTVLTLTVKSEGSQTDRYLRRAIVSSC